MLSLVALLAVDLDLDLRSSYFISSSSRAFEYFFDMILNRSFFCARKPSFCSRRLLRFDFLFDSGNPLINSNGTSMAFISYNFKALTGGK